MAARLSVAVVGGGMGGLTAALCLRRAGCGAHVYEHADLLGALAPAMPPHDVPRRCATRCTHAPLPFMARTGDAPTSRGFRCDDTRWPLC